MDALAPEAPEPITHNITIVTTKKISQARVMGVPPEEFGIERGARTIKDCNYCFHETRISVGKLIAQGYDEEQIKGIAASIVAPDTEHLSRDTVDEEQPESDSLNETARLVLVTEHYIRMDYEGNGKTCIYKVTTGGEGGPILIKKGKDDIEPVDDYPFAAATPVPVTHRFFGRSVADFLMDIQRIKTALIRGALDNVYQHNNFRTEVAESHAGPNTLDDLLVSRPGGVVRTKTPGGLNPLMVQDITGSIYPALQYMDAVRETRTGLSNQSQGIDANALQNQSATAVAQVFSASQMRVKLIARVLAEGVRDMFALLHGTIRKHGDQVSTVRLRNQWVDVDPRNWKTRNDMTINVGLGTGGKAQQFAQTMALANFQKELIVGGKGHMVGDDKLFNTASELTKIMGHKNPDKFFDDPSAVNPETGLPLHPPQPPTPPESVQVAQIKAQTDQQNMQIQAQLDERADNRKAQIETVQAQADIATQDRKTEAEIYQMNLDHQLKKEMALLEFQLKEREDARKAEMHQQDMQMKREQHQQAIAAGVFKVAAGAEAHDQKMEQMKNAPKPKGGK